MTARVAEGHPAVRQPRYDLDDRPFIVIWESTQACPLACLHCRAEAMEARHPGELSTGEAIDLMAQVAAFGRPAPLFVITGGDPFARPDLTDLVRAGTDAGLSVAVSPSGTPTLTRDNLGALREAGARAISLSLDGSTAPIHDTFRGVPGVFEQTLNGWTAAREVGLRVQINTTVTRANLTDLPNIVRIVHELGAMTWSAFLLVPTGRGRDLDLLGAAEVEDVLNFVYDAGVVVAARTTEAHHFRRVVLQRLAIEEHGADPVTVMGLGPLYQRLRADLQQFTGGVAARARRPPMDVNSGRGFVFVSHLGDVHPSGFLPLSAGNVRDRPLPEIYRTAELLTGLRDPDRLGGRCGRCEFRRICGGSRSRAYGLTGDPYATEPWCSYEPGSFPYPTAYPAARLGAPG
ncbi:MAG: TIGR04053 family radical SAM/SPASM domain-containing protein [Actinomycetes bacterium]